MPDPSPEHTPPDHYSWWVRFVLRTLAIRGITWLMLALSLLATAVVCDQTWQRQVLAKEQRFNVDATILKKATVERLDRYAQILQGTCGLFAASQSVEDSEFHAYVASLELNRQFQGILGIGFVEMVDGSEREEFLQKVSRSHQHTDHPILIHPPGDRPEYMVVRFVEPLDKNIKALGFDLATNDNRRQTAMRSCDSASIALTGKLDLIQSRGHPAAILFQPIYENGPIPTTIAERRAKLLGWVYAAFRANDLMEGVRDLTDSKLDYALYDGTSPSPDQLFSSSLHGVTASRNMLTRSDLLEMHGKSWTLQTQQSATAIQESGFIPIKYLAAGGIGMSLLIFGIAHSMASTGRRALALATGMTSELRRSGKELHASEERLAMIIDGSDDGVWDWDMTTNEVYFSPRWKGMLGYNDDEIENTFHSWEELVHPDDQKRAVQAIESYFEGQTPNYQLEHRLRHKDGSYRWILARGVVSRNAEGKPVRMAGSHVDLTELKLAEENLKRANEELQESQNRLKATLADLQSSHQALEKTQLELIQAAKLESVGTLAAGVAHEVKNPLQIIVMGLDYLEHRLDTVDEDSRVTLNDMRDAVLRADSITKELLQFSASSEFTRKSRDLSAVLERSLWLIKTDLTSSKVTLVKNLADKLPRVLVDAQKIQQVLINLIINSLQAMDHVGTLTLSTASGRLYEFLPNHGGANSPLQSNDEVVIVRLEDTGPGIPEDLLPRIFDPFFSTKAVGTGTGLGLSIVKKIIDLHGGVIQFVNSPECGLVATIAFAAVRPASSIPANKQASAT